MSSTSTNVALVGFKWMELLEKEFDKSFVGLDEVLRNVADDYEVMEMYESNRKLLTNMGSCFVQAVHKAQTIFQNSAKYEAELIHLREELAEAKAEIVKMDSEKNYLVCQLQSTLVENHKLKSPQDKGKKKGKQKSESKVCEDIQGKLASEMAVIQRIDWDAKKVEEKCKMLEAENNELRLCQVELESELVGARLDSKYLDKELAGRIQQIQILLAHGTSQEHKQKVWGQIEAEMHLQRSKTISNMCYSKQRVKEAAKKNQQADEHQSASECDSTGGNSRKSSLTSASRPGGSNRLKQVHIHKSDAEELGMAILGGQEHGLPIMISEVFPGTAVGRSRKICAGDVILSVNGDSFEDMGHMEAVRYLSALRGTIKFDLENRIDEEIDDVCDMNNRYYELFENGEGSVETKDHVQQILLKHPGRAQDVRGSVGSQSDAGKEVPQVPVHISPRKENGKAQEEE